MIRKLIAGPMRGLALALIVSLGVAGCATGGRNSADDPNLTPQQRQLRTEAARFNQTVGEGALVGALGGAALGALLGGDDPLAGAAIGAAAGAAVGAGAGYLVAAQQEQYASAEARLNAQIEAAQRDAARYRTIVDTTRAVVNSHKQNIAQLNSQYRAGQITAAQYQNQVSSISGDLASIQSLIDENRTIVGAYEEEIAEVQSSRRDAGQLIAARNEMVRQRQDLEKEYDELLEAVDAAPVAVG